VALTAAEIAVADTDVRRALPIGRASARPKLRHGRSGCRFADERLAHHAAFAALTARDRAVRALATVVGAERIAVRPAHHAIRLAYPVVAIEREHVGGRARHSASAAVLRVGAGGRLAAVAVEIRIAIAEAVFADVAALPGAAARDHVGSLTRVSATTAVVRVDLRVDTSRPTQRETHPAILDALTALTSLAGGARFAADAAVFRVGLQIDALVGVAERQPGVARVFADPELALRRTAAQTDGARVSASAAVGEIVHQVGFTAGQRIVVAVLVLVGRVLVAAEAARSAIARGRRVRRNQAHLVASAAVHRIGADADAAVRTLHRGRSARVGARAVVADLAGGADVPASSAIGFVALSVDTRVSAQRAGRTRVDALTRETLGAGAGGRDAGRVAAAAVRDVTLVIDALVVAAVEAVIAIDRALSALADRQAVKIVVRANRPARSAIVVVGLRVDTATAAFDAARRAAALRADAVRAELVRRAAHPATSAMAGIGRELRALVAAKRSPRIADDDAFSAIACGPAVGLSRTMHAASAAVVDVLLQVDASVGAIRVAGIAAERALRELALGVRVGRLIAVLVAAAAMLDVVARVHAAPAALLGSGRTAFDALSGAANLSDRAVVAAGAAILRIGLQVDATVTAGGKTVVAVEVAAAAAARGQT